VLSNVDREIASTKKLVADVRKELARADKEGVAVRVRLEKTREGLALFDRENEKTMLLMQAALQREGGVDALLSSYQAQLERMLKDKKEAELRRSECRTELLAIQRKLQKQYLTFESTFVPAFTDLAHLFLGMDLHVRMDASDTSGMKLIVEVRGTARRHADNLSESQRFFLDIALRMALTKFVSNLDSKGCLFIDTPEGSLDIAYEKRAGEMLAKFVAGGHGVVMTANLNTSKLLLALAKNCTRARMSLCRMTDWAELSDVQREEEDVFNEAFADIEKALDGGASPKTH
jgi:hypothetical protein